MSQVLYYQSLQAQCGILYLEYWKKAINIEEGLSKSGEGEHIHWCTDAICWGLKLDKELSIFLWLQQ